MRFITYDKSTGKIIADLTTQDQRALAAYVSATRGIMLLTALDDITDKVVDLQTGALVTPSNIVTVKNQATVLSSKSSIEADYVQNLTGYITTPHGAFSIAGDALTRLNGALLAATVEPGRFVDWRLDAGGVVPLGYADLVIIHRAVMDAIAGVMVTAQAEITAVDAPIP